MRTRTHRIEFHLNDSEYKRFHSAVKKSGLTCSAYLRHLINNRIPKDKPPAEYYIALSEIREAAKEIKLMSNKPAEMSSAMQFDEAYKNLSRLIMGLIETKEKPGRI